MVECAPPVFLSSSAYAPSTGIPAFYHSSELTMGSHLWATLAWIVTQRFRCSWSWHVDTLLPLFASQWRPDKMCVYYRRLPPSSFGAWTSITLCFSLVNRLTAWVYSRTYSKDLVTDILLVLKINHKKWFHCIIKHISDFYLLYGQFSSTRCKNLEVQLLCTFVVLRRSVSTLMCPKRSGSAGNLWCSIDARGRRCFVWQQVPVMFTVVEDMVILWWNI